MKYRVTYTQTSFHEEWVDANSFDEAQDQWEKQGLDADLFFIEDESGQQVFFD